MDRFDSYLKKHLVRINKNLFISKSDTQFYEKILRYKGEHSPEAHYRLGQKYEREGSLVKAYIHYNQVDTSSPFYFNAKRASRLLEERSPKQLGLAQPEQPEQPVKRVVPFYIKSIILFLFLLNIGIIALFFWKFPIHTIASTLKEWDTGMDVVYESEDVPYVFYIPKDTPIDEVERSLHEKAVTLGQTLTNQTLLLYGVLTTDPELSLQVLPLKNDTVKDKAFVIAEYNSVVDQSVKIRFLKKNNVQKEADDPYAYTFIGTNLVRTALQSYISTNGIAPTALTDLVNHYPSNFLSFIPNESFSGSNQIYREYSGNGGWVYNPEADTIAEMFFPNVPEFYGESTVPFSPIEVIVEKETYTLFVNSPPFIISEKKVGLGMNDLTPVGHYPVLDRVLDPIGERPNMFGKAGLGMGEIAIHGTYDEQSIESNKSLGCIRLLNQDVLTVFDFIPKGTIVEIVEKAPSTKTYTMIKNANVISPEKKTDIDQTTDTIFQWAG